MSNNTTTAPSQIDFTIQHGGSIYILRGHTDAAKEWIEQNISLDEETQKWGGGIVVEGRFISDIIEGLRRDGLEGRAF